MLEHTDVLVLFLLSALLLAYSLPRAKDRWLRKRRAKKAFKGEKKALPLLKKQGYRVIEGQAQGSVHYYVDGELKEASVRCDALVEKQGRRYVVEIKTGEQANVNLPQVRRQLFEYDRVFRPHGLLFVDMERQIIQEIHFGKKVNRHSRHIRCFLMGATLGFFLALFYQTAW